MDFYYYYLFIILYHNIIDILPTLLFFSNLSRPGASQTVTHKTGIPITALDISPQRTHAVIGGKEILKTIRVSPDHSSEEFNLRNAIISYWSTHRHVTTASRYKDQLTVQDVKWSHGWYENTIATAVANGGIVLYDLLRPGLDFSRFQGHSRQVHRLAFNPCFPAWLLSGSQDSSIRLWDLRMASTDRGVSTCGSTDLYNGNSDAVRDLRWAPYDGFMFATATDSGAIQLWDYRKVSAPVMRIAAHDKPCSSVDWHPDGKHIASGGTDRQVKVWDFSSSAERRQKPTFQFRTPQAVLNVRWRPPSWAGETHGSGDWQSSQIVTSYDKDDPRVHLWDLRRPHIPFREFDRYDSCATDLLWHSKDLLWTVGDSGIFTQTDIRYAPQVVHRRPTCSVAWSPNGEVLAFLQKRPSQRALGASVSEFLGSSEDANSGSENQWSQTPAEEILEDVTGTPRHRRAKSAGLRQSKSLGGSPPTTPRFNPVLSLEKALPKGKAPAACQLGAVGSIPGATMDEMIFRHLARNYSPLMDGLDDKAIVDPLQSLLESLDHNADRAEDAALFQLAQTWRIVKFSIVQELQRRARCPRQSSEKATNGVGKKLPKESGEKTKPSGDSKNEKMNSRLFKGVLDGGGLPHPDPESTSNIPTPLAQPLPDSPENNTYQIASLDEGIADIQPLPPSIQSSRHATIASSDWTMSDLDNRRLGHRQSQSSEDMLAPSEQSLPEDADELTDLQNNYRSAPRAIAGRTDWHRASPRRKGVSEDDEYGQKLEDKRAAIRDYKSFPKKILSLESPIEASKPPVPSHFRSQDSSESFPMFSASTDSSNRGKSVGASFSPNHQPLDTADDEEVDPADEEPAKDALVQDEDLQDNMSIEDNSPDNGQVHLERPSSPPPLVKESRPLQVSDEDVFRNTLAEQATHRALPGVTEDLSEITLPISPDLSGNKPWNAEAILKVAIRHYQNNSLVDIQTAAHLLHKLHILFSDCEQILPYKESELIYKTYNNHLLRQSMDVEAAELRLLCVPNYPAVYDYAQTDTFINVFCFTCRRPFENPKQDNSRCYRCHTAQEPCPICMSINPPPEWIQPAPLSDSDQYPSSEITSPDLSTASSMKTEPIPQSEVPPSHFDLHSDRPKGSSLWTWCQGCGHGGHIACITTWLRDLSLSEGGCATPGCFHDCGPGPRRDQNRAILVEESKRRDSASRRAGIGFVKRDPWAKGESKAVEKVRGMLSVESGGTGTGTGAGLSASTAAATGTPSTGQAGQQSGLASPKKVRLVTPTEQGKRRNRASKSIGGAGL